MSFVDRMKGVWEKLKDYWATNMERDHKGVSIAFGAFMIIAIVSLLAGISLFITGGVVNWGFICATILGGLTEFLVILTACFFGNDRKNSSEKEKPDK